MRAAGLPGVTAADDTAVGSDEDAADARVGVAQADCPLRHRQRVAQRIGVPRVRVGGAGLHGREEHMVGGQVGVGSVHG